MRHWLEYRAMSSPSPSSSSVARPRAPCASARRGALSGGASRTVIVRSSSSSSRGDAPARAPKPSSSSSASKPSSSSSFLARMSPMMATSRAKAASLACALALGALASSTPLALARDAAADAGALMPMAFVAEAPDASSGDGGGSGEDDGETSTEVVTDAQVLEEAWGLVFDNFLPARKSELDGFDRAAWEAIKREHEENPPKTREEAYDMIKDMLGTLGDRFTRFIEPERFTSMLKYDITGVGLNISEDAENPDRVKVLGLVLDSSAMKAGVVQDDTIVAVNGEDVKGKSAFAVSSLIQEAEGANVELTISRAGEDAPRVMKLKRTDGFAPPSSPVSMRLEGGHVGYIRLREFNSLAERDVAKAVQELRAQGADAYILDLRDNPGGLVQAGVEIARLFLPAESTIAYTEGRVVAGGVKRDTEVSATKTARNGSSSELPTKLKAITTSKAEPVVDASVPLVVFVNGRSASASEILTGALKDNCRATVVGSQTYGKGLIQSVYELSDLSGMVLTVGKYVTPGLVDIDQHGISVDYPMFPGFAQAKEHIGACRVPPRY